MTVQTINGRVNWRHVVSVALGVLAGAVATAGTLAVAVAGFTLSYDAIRKVGIASGVRPDWAWLLPVSIDGAMAVATVTAVVLDRMGRKPWYPWGVVVVGAGISIACNAVHAEMREAIKLDDVTAMAVSAIPALMLTLSVHLLVVLVDAAAQALAPAAVAPPVVEVATPPPAIDPANEVATAPATDSAEPVPVPSPAKLPASAARLARVRARRPDITQAEAAAKAKLSERTAQRYWVVTAPPDSQDDTEPINGNAVPELTKH